MSTFVHVKLSDGKQVDLTYQTTEVTLGGIKQIVSQQIGPHVLNATWYYGPRVVYDPETLTSLGVRFGSHCDLFVQSSAPAGPTTYTVGSQPIPSYPGMPQPTYPQPTTTYPQPTTTYPQPTTTYPTTTYPTTTYPQPTTTYSQPTYYPPNVVVAQAPQFVAPPTTTYVQPIIVGGGGRGGRGGRGGQPRFRKPWLHNPKPNVYQTIESKSNGLVIDIEGGSSVPGARIIAHSCHGGPNQRWLLDSEGFIRSQLNGMVLDIAHGRTQPGTSVIAYRQKHQNNLNQKWFFKRGFIVSRLNGLVLSLSGNRSQGSGLIVDTKMKRGQGKKGHQKWFFK